MTSTDQLDTAIAAAIHDLADRRPQVPSDALDRIATRSKRHRAASLASIAAVLALLAGAAVGANTVLGNRDAHTPPATRSDDWKQLEGPALATALGLELIPNGEMNNNPACQKAWRLLVTDAEGYCYTPDSVGIADPVEFGMLRWQLLGYPQSADLEELSSLEIQLRELMNSDAGNNPSVAEANEIRELHAQFLALQNQLSKAP